MSTSKNNVRVARGVRQTLPPNTILGNPFSRPGPAIVMTASQLAAALVNTSIIPSQGQVNTQDLIDGEGNVLDASNAVILVP